MLRIGYIPEHFSTPLLLASKRGFYERLGVKTKFTSFPSGSGHLISALKNHEIDVAVGLTEAFVRGISQGDGKTYRIVGEYVKSPLCWSISTGVKSPWKSVGDLLSKRNPKIGVSRIGSGSYVMSYVLALENHLGTSPFQFKVLHNFKNLRNAVNEGKADAFLWEYFTSKKYYDTNEIKKIGQIYTPWSSWMIVSSADKLQSSVPFLKGVQQGITYYNAHKSESLDFILKNFDYDSREDLEEWAKKVEFSSDVQAIDYEHNIMHTKKVLKAAGMIDDPDEVVDERLRDGVNYVEN